MRTTESAGMMQSLSLQPVCTKDVQLSCDMLWTPTLLSCRPHKRLKSYHNVFAPLLIIRQLHVQLFLMTFFSVCVHHFKYSPSFDGQNRSHIRYTVYTLYICKASLSAGNVMLKCSVYISSYRVRLRDWSSTSNVLTCIIDVNVYIRRFTGTCPTCTLQDV